MAERTGDQPEELDLGECSLRCNYDTGVITMHLDPDASVLMTRQQKRDLERRTYKMALKCAEGLKLKVQKGWV